MTVHSCLAGPACRSSTGRQGATTIAPNTLCPACNTHITNAVRQLPNDWAQLRNALGERSSTTGTKIRSTPTPAIPISTRREALMAAIVDMTDRAAAIVSDRLHTGQPATYHGRGIPTHAQHVVRTSVAIVEPNIDLLAAAPAEPMMVWAKPQRCDTHQHLIGHAEAVLAEAKPHQIERATQSVRSAYAAAGACDDCNGWGRHGQERQLIDMSGGQLAQQLVDLHNQARAELGHTRLRHNYPMPCPRCGARVGRDDGQTIITCDNRDTCRASWTEREYQFLAGLITRERLDMEILKWLLAEAYARLDDVQARISKITAADTATLTLPGAAEIIVEAVRQATNGHQTPAERAIATDRKATQERQTADDNWAWRNETPYRPPKPKPRKATRQAGPPIEELVNPEQATNACRQCNLIHRGQCA
ncbi:hypothetical protein [Mycobacterium marinum]|uniref:hypothetical protein n=1 Tax=Mycobacterium marinum TaxID=1781 RepID=UPI003562778A